MKQFRGWIFQNLPPALTRRARLGFGGFWPTLLLIAAFAVRYWQLDMKPPHFDEGINGHFVMEMWKDGFYRYDPTNFHGPLYFYFLQLSELIFGRGIFAFRFVTILFSTAAIALTFAHRRFFGAAAVWAGLVLTFSPAGVFYARYAIHEWLFILTQLIFSYGFFLYREERSRTSVALMTAGVCGAFATKETFFVFFGTWLIAIAIDRYYIRFTERPEPALAKKTRSRRASQMSAGEVNPDQATSSDIIAIATIGGIAVLAIFSGFFIHIEGLVDMVRAFAFWTKTGTGHGGHDKPLAYWLSLMWRYEWPILMALIASPFIFFKVKKSNERVMILTGFGVWLAYTLIPYKTPWLILNPLWPLAFSFGFVMLYVRPVRFVMPILGLLAVGISGYRMVDLTFRQFVNPREPYVYVQSTMQFKNTMDWIYARARQRPEDLNMRLLVLNRDTWPMPWTLSDFPNLTWGKAADADLHDAGVVLIDGDARSVLESRLQGKYLVQPFQIRDAYEGGWAYFDYRRFKDIVPLTGDKAGVFESSNMPKDKPTSPEAK